MDNRILDFLSKHSVCSFTTLLADGAPHAAAMHFSFSPEPPRLYFLTNNTSRKMAGLLKGETRPSAVVVGFSDEELITLQIDGQVTAIADGAKIASLQEIHFAKHPKSRKYAGDPTYIFLELVPTWWRFTDYNTKPATILSSEG